MANRKYWIFGVTFLVALVGDQLSKVWARDSLRPLRGAIVVIEGLFDFRYSENTGSAFGLFRGLSYGSYLLFAVGIVALIVIIGFLRKAPADRPRIAAELGLVAGGAVGNLIDRIRFGRVTDFIVWKYHGHEWPTFNIADAALVVGVIALLLDSPSANATPATDAPADAKSRKRR